MELAFPTYKITRNSPTADLRVLENLYSEIGGFASTILDNRYLAFSKECVKRLNKVTAILDRRIDRMADKIAECAEIKIDADLSALTVNELYNLYRFWPERHQKRVLEGREHMTFYFEGRIVRELKRRKTLTASEQLKVDYCKMTYRSEIENLSFIYSVPVDTHNNLIVPEGDQAYSSSELTSVIKSYSSYKSIAERELLVEYVDLALDSMQSAEEKAMLIGVAAEIVELGRRCIVKVPAWTVDFLSQAIDQACKDPRVPESELVLPLLTLNLQNHSPKLEREARRIINRCYKSAFDNSADLGKRIEDLHAAVTCCDYVTRFSIRKAAALWHDLSTQALSPGQEPTPKQIFQLLDIAKACEAYANISAQSKEKLKEMLSDMAQSDSPEVRALNKLVKMSA